MHVCFLLVIWGPTAEPKHRPRWVKVVLKFTERKGNSETSLSSDTNQDDGATT